MTRIDKMYFLVPEKFPNKMVLNSAVSNFFGKACFSACFYWTSRVEERWATLCQGSDKFAWWYPLRVIYTSRWAWKNGAIPRYKANPIKKTRKLALSSATNKQNKRSEVKIVVNKLGLGVRRKIWRVLVYGACNQPIPLNWQIMLLQADIFLCHRVRNWIFIQVSM